ncbi:hypothetical protein K7432_003844 [Basidiobolus ranarum]|uniref:Uncharacterized protein n=1 Tax=Basidiobolus ranarum TaxID=34480 RepID=A0ABR2WZ89_9FUNG
MDDSYDFCQYLQGSTTDHLRVFRGPLIKYNEEIQGWDSISFLQRCPKLEKVRFNPTQPNTFKWAVKRRDLLTASDLELGRSSTSKLVPLQDVHMQCQYCTSLSIVQDIVYAFRNTIKSITVEEHLHPRFHFNPEPLRWDWLLPNLVKIHIDETDFTLFDFGSLNLCPSLEDLHLTGGYGDIDCDVIPEFGPILKLPNLRNIQLEYEISFQFDLASLQYSPLLETLIISNDVPLSEDDESPMIRPTDSPCWEWTWDWYLPHLKRMDLTGESAFLFQFRFISSCPSLQYLRLDTDEYERSMSLDQIARTGVLLPSAYKNQVNEVKHRFEFALQGRWEMSKYTLHVLLLQYMPHVTDIDFSCANRIDPLGVIDVTQKLSHVRNVTFNLACHDPDIEDTLKYLSEHGRGTFGSVNYTMLQ